MQPPSPLHSSTIAASQCGEVTRTSSSTWAVRDTEALRVALVLADTVLIPVQPRGLDVWALSNIAGLIDGARATRDGLRAIAVLNLADPGISPDDTWVQPRRSPNFL